MSVTIIDGKALADHLIACIADSVADMVRKYGLKPGLAALIIGDNPASQIYVRNKMRRAREVGMYSIEHRLPADLGQKTLIDYIHQFNSDPAIHGVLVQLPLPQAIEKEAVFEAIDPIKDVDGFHPINIGRLAIGSICPIPCTPLGCLFLLKKQLGDLSGRKATIIGRSTLVGKPMAQLLLSENVTVTLCHSYSRDLVHECQQSEILVVATGQAKMIGKEHVNSKTVVIDVGINHIPQADMKDGKRRLIGDVDFEAVAPHVAAITPVPGGVGPMTVACLIANSVNAARHSHGLTPLDWSSQL